MPTFRYEAMDNRGDEVNGTLKAAGEKAATEELRAMGYFVTRLKQVCPHCGGAVRDFFDRCEECGKWLTGQEQESETESGDREIDQANGGAMEGRLLDLLRVGKKIDAIKVYREATGLGLAECKAHVESLGRRHGLTAAGPVGCARSAALLFAVMAAMAVAWLVW